MESIVQILINALISGLLLSLVAYGFGLIFNVTKIFHLAHAGIYVAGVYFFIFINKIITASTELPDFFSIFISLVFVFISTILLGWLIEKLVYYPLYKKGSNQIISLISSMGLYIVIINIIAMLSGNETKVINQNLTGIIELGTVIITLIQIKQVIIAIGILLFVWSLLFFLKTETKIRAVSDNSMLASVVGIEVKKIRLLVILIGSLLAVSGALLKAYDIGIDPYMGMPVTLSAAVVVILSGTYSLRATILTSFAVSLLQHFTEWFFSAQWKDGITFLLLLIVMLFRTEGILSYNIRKDYQ